jgi:catechol 2,3-dioxygenase-like lactoylglutathione lyase family enzyme
MNITHVDHIVFNVSDIDASVLFYERDLGLSIERLEEYRAGSVPFPSVRVNEATILDLFPPGMHAGTNCCNVNHIALVVDDTADAIVAALGRVGLPIVRGPVKNNGARGTGTAVYTRDPDGNQIELRTYK